MHGKTRRQTAYYACQPSQNLGRGAERAFPDHPVSIWVREEFLFEGILGFFSERIFGVNRRELLEADLKRVECEGDRGARRRIKSLEKAIGQLEARQDRLVRTLELDDDTDGATFRRIRERMDELENERLRKLKDLHALRGEESDADPASPDLLDQLPVSDVNLSSAPEHVLRRMFESFRLQVRYDKVASWATCRVAIREEALDQLQTDSSALFAAQTNDPDGGCSLLVGAPGRALPTSVQPSGQTFYVRQAAMSHRLRSTSI
jgi:site-specific DNA recombinase